MSLRGLWVPFVCSMSAAMLASRSAPAQERPASKRAPHWIAGASFSQYSDGDNARKGVGVEAGYERGMARWLTLRGGLGVTGSLSRETVSLDGGPRQIIPARMATADARALVQPVRALPMSLVAGAGLLVADGAGTPMRNPSAILRWGVEGGDPRIAGSPVIALSRLEAPRRIGGLRSATVVGLFWRW